MMGREDAVVRIGTFCVDCSCLSIVHIFRFHLIHKLSFELKIFCLASFSCYIFCVLFRDQVAPMVATSILCILLPTFRKMNLPADIISSEERCRPIFQPSVWRLIRDCLGRCGDSDLQSGRGTSLLSRGGTGGEESNEYYDVAMTDQLLRRRSAHVMRLMIEYERECLTGTGKKSKKKMKGKNQLQSGVSLQLDLWMKYVLCFEMLEMETELHLVEQVWETVNEIASNIDNIGSDEEVGSTFSQGMLVWNDISSLLCRILLSEPQLRKIGLYRFLSGQAGVDVTSPNDEASKESTETQGDEKDESKVFMRQPKSKGKIRKTALGGGTIKAAPLSIVSVDFVLDVLIPSYDSLVGTKVGTNMQIEEDGKLESASIANLLGKFLSSYTVTLASASDENEEDEGSGTRRLSEFVNRIFGPELIQNYKARSLSLFYRSVATALDSTTSVGNAFTIDPVNIQAMIRSMRAIFSSGGAPRSMQEELKLNLALVLKNATWKKVDVSIVLQVLALYPPSEELSTDESETSSQSKSRDALKMWVLGLGDGKWVQDASSACASAYVLGQLHSFGESDMMVNLVEREIGMAICILCSLSGNGELLWPAVFKGLQNAPSAISLSATPGFCKANRSMILLEYGCKEGILSGMGNGDMLIDKERYMMPPPQHIETLLSNAIQFVVSQLVSVETTLFKMNEGCGSTRSSTSSGASSYIAVLIGQLRVLYLAYPSSASLSQSVNILFEDTVKSLVSGKDLNEDNAGIHIVKFLTLTYAALSCGATFAGGEATKLNQIISTCHSVLKVELTVPAGINKLAKQANRSIFQYSKW